MSRDTHHSPRPEFPARGGLAAAALSRRRVVQVAAGTSLAGAAGVAAGLAPVGTASAAATPGRVDPVRDTIRRTAVFLDEKLSYRGGYVWSYLPDLSTTWGEMEARRTMCWIQPPGTPSVGHALLDAFHATGDKRLYQAARRTGHALARAQRSEGGWNYIHDFRGERALREWYETIGINGWRLEEFQHLYDNSTFDDAATSTSAQLILRLHLINPFDPVLARSLYKAIAFVVASQFRGGVGDGGWPQRWPADPNATKEMPWPETLPSWLPGDARHGMEDGDYTQHVTFNDNVLGENIKFLLMCVISLGRHDLIAPVRRAMECVRRMQQPAPQAGWGLQHLRFDRGDRRAGAVAAGRSYEPRALTTHTTQTNVEQLFKYTQLTGDRSFLDGVPAAIEWLESCRLSAQQKADNPLIASRSHPTYVEEGTNKGLFVHRFGSNINNGAYYYDYDHTRTLSHYSAGRSVNTGALRSEYDRLMALSDQQLEDLRARSPLTRGRRYGLPTYFSLRDLDLLDLQRGATQQISAPSAAAVDAIVAEVADKPYWLSPAEAVTNPFRGDGPTAPYDGMAYMSKHVGDVYDTSPYSADQPPEVAPYQPQEPPLVISTSTFVAKLGTLISHLAQ
ncbi:pectate lyase [Nocardioides insulae]|uniref:pectate lyase n=1 Tax=Nocardioides insulae TaxID=394734 RepID=UPI0012FCFB61|nr:pectate lyase [Nocardioides insulae]